MSTKHKIGWLNIPGYIPATWNPIVGCTKVSPGCDNCYAEKMATRLSGMPLTSYKYSSVITRGKWNGKTFIDEYSISRLFTWWKKPHAIFVCSMGDLFHESISFSQIDEVITAMGCNPQHIYILLTKRPERMREYFRYLNDVKLKDFGGYDPPDFFWLGVTVENQEQADKRIPILLDTPARVRFVSCEPLLELVDLTKLTGKIDWVIAGGETGNKHRPMSILWVSALMRQCRSSVTPFFFKQWHAKTQGRLLYGKEYSEYPEIITSCAE